MSGRPTTDEILAQAAWVNGLARRLVADAHLAEDLAQETLTAALERPPAEGLKLRPWLASVLRNFRNQAARSEGRRRMREQAAARREAQDRAGDGRGALDELELHRELTEAVLGLEEPFRTAIVLRFLRELPPREIARRQGVPVKTVDSRIARGLAKLRTSLDRARGGDSRAWMLLFASKLEPASSLTTGTLGVLAMNTKLILALVSIATLGVVAVFLRDAPAPAELDRPVVEAATPQQPATPPAAIERGPELDARGSGRVAEPAPLPSTSPATATADEDAPQPLHHIRGRVLDVDGAPLAGLAVSLLGAADARTSSGAGGWFELSTTAVETRIEAVDERFVNVRQGVFNAHDPSLPIVVVAPAMQLAGLVTDQDQWELAGATLRLEFPQELEVRIDADLESSRKVGWSTDTDHAGRYLFERLPAVDGALLTVVLDGYEAVREPAPTSTALDHRIVLSRPSAPTDGTLAGRVVDPEGASVPRARVALGLASVLADDQGEFRIDLGRAVTAETLRAVQTGYLPATLPRPFEPAPDKQGPEAHGWPEFIEIRLPGRALSLSGRVLDSDGEPVEGARVWISDPTPFAVIGMMPVSAESLSTGARVPPQALEFAASGPREDGASNWSYRMSSGPPNAFWNWVRTDSEGRFGFDGLLDRDYALEVMDDSTLRTHKSERVRAGRTGVDVRLPKPQLWTSLSGRVVTDSGRPLEGIRVQLGSQPFTRNSRVFGGRSSIGLVQTREEVATDSSGRFEFQNVPRQAVYLSLESSAIVPTRFDLDGTESGTDLEIPVEARCRVEVLIERTPGATDLKVYDAAGERLEALRISAGSVTSSSQLAITGGTTGLFSVSSRAASFVLMDAQGADIARLPVNLVPGEVNRIRD